MRSGTWSGDGCTCVWTCLRDCSSRNQCCRICGTWLAYANVLVRNQVCTLPVDGRIPREQLSVRDTCCVCNTVAGLAGFNNNC